MTQVDFYSQASDKLELARRIAYKAWQQNKAIMVYSQDESELDRIDAQWWLTPATSFLPHARSHAAHAPTTPIVLGTDIGDLPHCDVLINLSEQPPGFFSRFERLIEIVSTDESDRQAARLRWRFYQERGYALHNHNMAP
ncbi:MAG: DNA polymerase III subunit chi [Betaproteobacteria bacterium]|nr:DNA polymerase III subunit chi [Betaproteobacteria bacterium]